MAPSESALRLKALRARAIGLRELARAIGWDPSRYLYYEDKFRKAHLPREFLELIKPHLVGRGSPRITPAEIDALGGYLSPVPTRLCGGAPAGIAMVIPETERDPLGDVPVWGSAQGDAEGAILLTSASTSHVRRSKRIFGTRHPFAFHVIGSSMSPALEHGDKIVVHPALLPQPGRDCVFVRRTDEGQTLALIKRLVKSSSTSWCVRQFNPPKDFDLPRRKWPNALLIIEKRIA